MATAGQVIAFATVIQLGAMSPGPDFAVVVRQAAVTGRRGGMAAALGVACGVFVWATAAALGVAALLATSATAFTITKIAGAGYLLYLGARSLQQAYRGSGAPLETTAGTANESGVGDGFRRGLLCNLLNPKAAAFFVALMPQFLGNYPATADTLALSAIAVLITGTWFVVLANVVGALRAFFTRQRVRRALDAGSGAVLIGLGVRLAATSN
ncbi:LysE family transporter [Microtetraspora sp. AC03309]|uniref:LysE family translocator n=1 Tax=Microtetraspora sp. AC03309 TaxID=2779376 RepID=UPI001E4E808A|nr:LysE family transporter [Microtetraspora sp. AC03309]MCC5575833.1 LysE family transporter [Microtetraspora sp. AC03309]